jgi:hypothetical protein
LEVSTLVWFLAVFLGILLRLLRSGSLRNLSEVKLRGEGFLLGIFTAQMLIMLLPLPAAWHAAAYLVWITTFPPLVLIAWWNRREPGLWAIGLGLLLNFLVVVSNGGMPVSAAAALVVNPALAVLRIPATDFAHVLLSAGTRLPWLADIIPLPGPAGIRGLLSIGDCFIILGIALFIVFAHNDSDEPSGTDKFI